MNPANSSQTAAQIVHDPSEARATLQRLRAEGKRVGLVPTMGALHEGHLSLVRASLESCDYTVVTIFVNPTQFGPGEDFSEYPRTLAADLDVLSDLGVDLVFAPAVDSIYPVGFSTAVSPPKVAEPLEGAHRPSHFEGVCTVVLKLFQMLPAHVAFFGQKDFQQTCVVKSMVRDLNVPIEVDVRPTVRESDGLALSSRNRYLSAEERSSAVGLSRCLQTAASMIEEGETDGERIASAMHSTLAEAGVVDIDYALVADPQSLTSPDKIRRPAIALVAARVGQTRLIDNRIIE